MGLREALEHPAKRPRKLQDLAVQFDVESRIERPWYYEDALEEVGEHKISELLSGLDARKVFSPYERAELLLSLKLLGKEEYITEEELGKLWDEYNKLVSDRDFSREIQYAVAIRLLSKNPKQRAAIVTEDVYRRMVEYYSFGHNVWSDVMCRMYLLDPNKVPDMIKAYVRRMRHYRESEITSTDSAGQLAYYRVLTGKKLKLTSKKWKEMDDNRRTFSNISTSLNDIAYMRILAAHKVWVEKDGIHIQDDPPRDLSGKTSRPIRKRI